MCTACGLYVEARIPAIGWASSTESATAVGPSRYRLLHATQTNHKVYLVCCCYPHCARARAGPSAAAPPPDLPICMWYTFHQSFRAALSHGVCILLS